MVERGQERAGFWDACARGCGALRAAVLRNFGAEAAAAAGSCTAGIYWDVDKFFDSIDPERVAC
eukprot:9240870-Lingulodinium_polyedra.AAC.1